MATRAGGESVMGAGAGTLSRDRSHNWISGEDGSAEAAETLGACWLLSGLWLAQPPPVSSFGG